MAEVSSDAYANAIAQRREVEAKLERLRLASIRLTGELHEIDSFLIRYRRLAKLPAMPLDQIIADDRPQSMTAMLSRSRLHD